MDNKSWRFSLILIALNIVFCAPFVISQEVDDESEFTYDMKSANGPDHWGEIHPEWSMCNKGNLQSPIDLTHKRVQTTSSLGRLDRDYKPANTTLINRGHDMMVDKVGVVSPPMALVPNAGDVIPGYTECNITPSLRWIGGGGHMHINGTKYQLNQLHWHTPTEHTINGRRFNLELHLVHQSRAGKFAVVGIMYKIGRPDSLLSIMEPYLKALTSTKGVETSVGIIDPRDIKIGSRKYYRYIGSLTTPPCHQNVIWTIVKKVRTVSRAQVRAIRKAVHDDAEANARPVQPLNNRWLKLYRPDDHQKY